MTITISLTIAIDGADLTTALDKLAAMLTAKDEDGRMKDEVQTEAGSDPSSLNPQNAPKRPRAPSRPPKTPATLRTPVLPPIPAATNEAKDEGGRMKDEGTTETAPIPSSLILHPSSLEPRKYSGDRLPFAAFDALVRAEMKRLAMDGRIPGAKLWDSERDPRLPTLGAVLQRYGTSNLAGLAEALGMEPPLTSRNYTITQNGANAIYAKEATP